MGRFIRASDRMVAAATLGNIVKQCRQIEQAWIFQFAKDQVAKWKLVFVFFQRKSA